MWPVPSLGLHMCFLVGDATVLVTHESHGNSFVEMITGNAMTTSVIGAVVCGLLIYALKLGHDGKHLVQQWRCWVGG